ncbi:MAG: hypothetical protein F2585_11705, partial [Actinobacteria bacterium]|nr:hypothetical protein [Actinomycetota bacterium]
MNTRRMRGVALVGVLVVVALVVGLVWFPRSTGTGTSSETSESVVPDSGSSLPGPSTESPVPDPAPDQPAPDQPRANPDPVFVAPRVEAEIAAEGSATVIVRLDTTLSG